MGIEFDSAATSQSFGSSRTYAHDVGTGPFRIMLCGGVTNNYAGAPTGCSFNGVAMSPLRGLSKWDTIAGYWYYLIDPAAGIHNVIYTFGGNGSITVGSVCYEGVDPNNPFGVDVGASGTSTGPSVAVSSGEGELVVDFMGFRAGSTNMTAGALQTARVNNNSGAGDNTGAGASEEPGQASVTMSWSITTSTNWVIGAVPLKPKITGEERAVKYFHNVWDPSRAILDNAGRDIPVDQIQGDNYLRTLGVLIPTAKVYSDLVENPEVGYIESIKKDDAQRIARIKAGKESLLETFLSRLAGRGV